MTDTNLSKPSTEAETRVLFNADCPVCNFEITHYERYADKAGLPVRFEDLNVQDLADWGVTEDQAARRLHVLKDGEVTSGIPAFLVLWADMPRYRLLGRLVGLPGIRQAASVIYDYVLAPLLYRWHRRRQFNRNALS